MRDTAEGVGHIPVSGRVAVGFVGAALHVLCAHGVAVAVGAHAGANGRTRHHAAHGGQVAPAAATHLVAEHATNHRACHGAQADAGSTGPFLAGDERFEDVVGNCFRDTAAVIHNGDDDLVVAAGGSISAEHGLGRLKTDEARRYKSAVEIATMSAVRLAMDPQRIMNPGVLF